MGIWPTPWMQQCMVEGNRFWFYLLLLSIILGVMQLFGSSEVAGDKKSGGEKRAKDGKKVVSVRRGVIVRRLLTDGFDLFIPGSITG